MEARKLMDLVDAHVRLSLRKFAGEKVDTDASRRAIQAALTAAASPSEPIVTVAVPVPPPALAVTLDQVPHASPPKSKRTRIFGG